MPWSPNFHWVTGHKVERVVSENGEHDVIYLRMDNDSTLAITGDNLRVYKVKTPEGTKGYTLPIHSNYDGGKGGGNKYLIPTSITFKKHLRDSLIKAGWYNLHGSIWAKGTPNRADDSPGTHTDTVPTLISSDNGLTFTGRKYLPIDSIDAVYKIKHWPPKDTLVWGDSVLFNTVIPVRYDTVYGFVEGINWDEWPEDRSVSWRSWDAYQPHITAFVPVLRITAVTDVPMYANQYKARRYYLLGGDTLTYWKNANIQAVRFIASPYQKHKTKYFHNKTDYELILHPRENYLIP